MEIIQVTADEYSRIISKPYYAFGTAAFNELNKDRCKEIYYLLFKEGKYRLGLIGGKQGNIFSSPFSAPYGGFTYFGEGIKLNYIDAALELLKKWAPSNGIESIHITLPPAIYDESFISKLINCLFRGNYDLNKVDLNYSLNLDSFDDSYYSRIWDNARRNLRNAERANLIFKKCEEDKDKETAFQIIIKNREAKGYPLHMSWQRVMETSKIIQTDFFLALSINHLAVASAVVFHIQTEIVQMIFWGDLPGANDLRVMNYLSFKLFEYYKLVGKKIIDIGPASSDSIPNYGLCEFKEGIGCEISTKLTFSQNL